jgi:hypothetical protein
MSADVLNWSLDDGGTIDAWNATTGVNQQWYLDYVEDGWFQICSRYSAKCLDVAGASKMDGADVVQSRAPGGYDQQWRLLPVDAPLELDAPSAPSNLVAIDNAASILLRWTASPEADVVGYSVFRAESASGPYSTIARGVSSASFVDNSASPGTPYFYAVKATDRSLNRSAYSNQARATASGKTTVVEHLAFDGNTRDDTFNLNHGATFSSASYGAGRVGWGALLLDGSSQFVQLPPTIARQPAITVAAWVYWKGGASWQRIFDFGNDQSQYMFLTPSSGDGTLRFGTKNRGGEQRLDAPVLAAQTWSHVAVTLGASGASLYVNGHLVAESSTLSIRPSDFAPVSNYIGRSSFPDPLFAGSIDDFRVYNYALAPADVAQLAAGM